MSCAGVRPDIAERVLVMPFRAWKASTIGTAIREEKAHALRVLASLIEILSTRLPTMCGD